MANLKSVSIVLNTHSLDAGKVSELVGSQVAVAHIFVKNRKSTSSTPESDNTFIANKLAYEEMDGLNGNDINPYLGYVFGIPLSSTFFQTPGPITKTITLRTYPIPLEEVVLPVVNIHFLTAEGADVTWIFDYTITFQFDGPDPQPSFFWSSNTDGITGIILNHNNPDYSGICVENPFNLQPAPVPPLAPMLLYKIEVEFHTHTNSSKPADTQLNLHIVNRQNGSSSQDLVVALDLFKNQEFVGIDPPPPPARPNPPDSVSFTTTVNPLSSNSIQLADMVLPVVSINIAPKGSATWEFDYRVRYYFQGLNSDDDTTARIYSSTHTGVVLNQDFHKCAYVYQGDPFPTEAPPPLATLSPSADTSAVRTKSISASFLDSKLSEFIVNRQGVTDDSPSPALWRVRLHNSGDYGVLPESYYDLQSIEANPPPPGTIVPAGYQELVDWTSSPASVGQFSQSELEFLNADDFFNDINSDALAAGFNGISPTPLEVGIQFETNGPPSITGYGSDSVGEVDLTTFYANVYFTLSQKPNTSLVDLMSWADIPNVNLAPYINVVAQGGTGAGTVASKVQTKLFKTLTTPDPFTLKSKRDSINSLVNSWLLGGVVDGKNNCQIQPNGVTVSGDGIAITYAGPPNAFPQAPPTNWPKGFDFSQGPLANIEHIIVLTMENRSFDHMLGYLSLPVENGGMGRDIDGLKGGESNMLGTTKYSSFPFPPGDTIFSPDPPHSYEPVAKAINGGKMDGFVSTYNDQRGPKVAPRIMGYHTAANVPTYDALARDFSICHRWFAPHPGPTFCNRFYELTGRLNIDPNGFWEYSNSSPLKPVFTPTIFDHLDAAGVTWRYFEHEYCFLRFFEKYTFNTSNIFSFTDPEFGFVNQANLGTLPSVTFIDPHFIELPPGGNCDGPPADIQQGQLLVKQVVEAVVSSPLWSKTLLIVTYDEHGGFYDHVPPPQAVKVSPELLPTYGVRVPTFVISPFMDAGVFGRDGLIVTTGSGGDLGVKEPAGVKSLYFDHTSILKTIARCFMSENPPYMGPRYAAANDLSAVLRSTPRPDQFRPFIPYNLVYGASKMALAVPNSSQATGTDLWQYTPNNTDEQQFSFEDAGDGFVYIRTQTGRLYVTVNVPPVIVATTPVTVQQNTPPPAIKQDVKYDINGVKSGPKNPDNQRWKLSPPILSEVNNQSFTISNAAFKDLVLQPIGGSAQSEAAVVLAAPTGGVDLRQSKNSWQVTSPLLNYQLVIKS